MFRTERKKKSTFTWGFDTVPLMGKKEVKGGRWGVVFQLKNFLQKKFDTSSKN